MLLEKKSPQYELSLEDQDSTTSPNPSADSDSLTNQKSLRAPTSLGVPSASEVSDSSGVSGSLDSPNSSEVPSLLTSPNSSLTSGSSGISVPNDEVWGIAGKGSGPTGYLSVESLRRMQRCLGSSDWSLRSSKRLPLSQVVSQLPFALGGDPSTGRIFKYHNFHLEMPDGERRFLKIELQKNVEGEEQLRMAVAKDDHGFPVPIIIPREDQIDPSEETIDRYKSLGRVTYEERAFAVQYPKGVVDIVLSGGQVRDFSLSTSKALVECNGARGALNCSCMRIQTASIID